ncbi:kinesin-like protein KIF20B [Parasteatoda tepidariorum]|uniref:kinesin-like protein KIF20B n=1 Tax=Parasteatoda tepidariorum TaxID=114398 RepID=UPI0039BCAA14
MENAKEKLSSLLHKKEKYIQTGVQLKEKKDFAMNQNTVSDRNDFISDSNHFNKCCFCTKVFLNSKFLIQHILRRHSENLIAMYRKLNDLTRSDAQDHFSQNDVLNLMANEFSKLRNDLEFIKSTISNQKSNQNFYHNSLLREAEVHDSFADILERVDALTSQLQALKVTNAKIESDISHLKVQWTECDVEKFSDSTKLKDTLIFQTLKDEILLEIQNLIMKNNEEQNQNLNKISSNFKADVGRLEHLVKMNLENIDTSNLVQETLKSLEKEIEFFFSCHKAKKQKVRVCEFDQSRKNSTRIKPIKPYFLHEKRNFGYSSELDSNFSQEIGNFDDSEKLKRNLSHEKSAFGEKLKLNFNHETSSFCNGEKLTPNFSNDMSSFGDSEKLLRLEKKLNVPEGSKNPSFSDYKSKKYKDSELNQSEKMNAKVKEVEYLSRDFDINEIPLLLEKKLSALNIPDGTNRLSNSDYSAKMKLIEAEREELSRKNPSFSDVYSNLNSAIDNIVFQKLNSDKKLKKIRFSLTPRKSGKKLKKFAENSDVKVTQMIVDPQEGSSKKIRHVRSTSKNITPVNIPSMELRNDYSNSRFNSAASLKLISSSNRGRKLPSGPMSVSNELSPYDSMESDF